MPVRWLSQRTRTSAAAGLLLAANAGIVHGRTGQVGGGWRRS
jgi:hypothetical protein